MRRYSSQRYVSDYMEYHMFQYGDCNGDLMTNKQFLELSPIAYMTYFPVRWRRTDVGTSNCVEIRSKVTEMWISDDNVIFLYLFWKQIQIEIFETYHALAINRIQQRCRLQRIFIWLFSRQKSIQSRVSAVWHVQNAWNVVRFVRLLLDLRLFAESTGQFWPPYAYAFEMISYPQTSDEIKNIMVSARYPCATKTRLIL